MLKYNVLLYYFYCLHPIVWAYERYTRFLINIILVKI
jgi:hypothetical protein